MDKSKLLAIVGVLLASGCAAGHAGNAASSAPPEPAVASLNAPAPAFSEPTLTGTTLSMASLHGRPVYLNFFASWCPPCNEEAADVNALQEEHGKQGLQVVGVDVLENQAKAQSFVSKHHLVYPAVVDGGTLRDAYNINGLPVHVFIDRTGVVREIVVGEMSRAEMEAGVKKIL
jgi:peroxiredoxin